MRLPVTIPLNSRDGISNKNARLTNALREDSKSAQNAVIRPGLKPGSASAGNGTGLVAFSDEIISVYGSTLGATQNYIPVNYTKSQLPDSLMSTAYGFIGGNDKTIIVSEPFSGLISTSGDGGQLWQTFGPYYYGDPVNEDYEGPTRMVYNGQFFLSLTVHSDTVGKSYDGENWEFLPCPALSNPSAIAVRPDGMFIIVDNQYFITTYDGINFTAPASFDGLITFKRDIVYGGGQFVMCADGFGWTGNVYRSTDGFSWSKVSVPDVSLMYSIAYGNGVYSIGGLSTLGNYSFWFSYDAINWFLCDYGFPTETPFVQVRYGGGIFLGSTSYGSTTPYLAYSENGLYWETWDWGTQPSCNPLDLNVTQSGNFLILDGQMSYTPPYNAIVVYPGRDITGITTVSGDFFDFSQSVL